MSSDCLTLVSLPSDVVRLILQANLGERTDNLLIIDWMSIDNASWIQRMLIHYLPQTVTALSIDVRSNPFKDDVQYWRSVAENLFERNNMKEMKLK
ncbi:hypothetical protein PRIPAC_91291, partial [Pristionchus pacificus]|uniref:Uncharacterized protein n=1 Tax=Pristionchus pacificus TaxID=54126 RepID=A0A2A6CW28_PRIPA